MSEELLFLHGVLGKPILQLSSAGALTYIPPVGQLTLPTLSAGANRVVALVAVFPTASFLTVSAAGNYTVDWGDGIIENFAADTIAQHEYDYTNVALNGTLIPELGYKQAIMSITPQTGQTLTTLAFNNIHTGMLGFTFVLPYTQPLVDITIAAQNLTSLTLNQFTGQGVCNMLKQFNLVDSNISTFDRLFLKCSKLKSLLALNSRSVIPKTCTYMFKECTDLEYIGTLNLVGVTTIEGLFSDCSSLQRVKLINTQSITSLKLTFFNCRQITTVDIQDTQQCTNFTSAFSYCLGLRTIPLLNTSSGTVFDYMFAGCPALTSVPLLDTANGTSFDSMFEDCTGLTTIPVFNTSNGTVFDYMFTGCTSLWRIPALNLTNGTSCFLFVDRCRSVIKFEPTNIKMNIELKGTYPAAALNQIYTNLGVVTSKTITIRAIGGPTSDISIAQAKGWTVNIL